LLVHAMLMHAMRGFPRCQCPHCVQDSQKQASKWLLRLAKRWGKLGHASHRISLRDKNLFGFLTP